MGGIVGIIASPFVGYFLAELLDSLLPPIAEEVPQITPSVPSVTLPSVSLELEEIPPEYLPSPPSIPYYPYKPLIEKMYGVSYKYDSDMTRVTDASKERIER